MNPSSVLVLTSVLLLCGCNTNTDNAAVPTTDPVAEFKTLVPNKLGGKFSKKIDRHSWSYEVKSIEHDVIKTDSLISPYKGIIDITVELHTQHEDSEPNEFTGYMKQLRYEYSWSNDAWSLAKSLYKSNLHKRIDDVPVKALPKPLVDVSSIERSTQDQIRYIEEEIFGSAISDPVR